MHLKHLAQLKFSIIVIKQWIVDLENEMHCSKVRCQLPYFLNEEHCVLFTSRLYFFTLTPFSWLHFPKLLITQLKSAK